MTITTMARVDAIAKALGSYGVPNDLITQVRELGRSEAASDMTELQMILSWAKCKHPITGEKVLGWNNIHIIRARAKLVNALKAAEVSLRVKVPLLEDFNPVLHGDLARQGVPWGKNEDDTLIDHWNSSVEPTAQMVAHMLGRSVGAVVHRIFELGLYRSVTDVHQANMRRLKSRGLGVPVAPPKHKNSVDVSVPRNRGMHSEC